MLAMRSEARIAALEAVDWGRLHHRPNQLSGGQRSGLRSRAGQSTPLISDDHNLTQVQLKLWTFCGFAPRMATIVGHA
jgi:hypothetical protein